MKSTLIALFAVISIPNAANADIRSNCFKQWNTNYRMVEFCIEQQTEALSKLQRTSSSPIMSRCRDQWNENYRMINFCIEQQSDSANRLGVTREYSVQPMLTGGARSGSKSHDYVRSGGGCITANNVTHCF
jgi:hypothetical protein